MAKEYSRTQRIGDQMQRELAQLIRREVKDPRVGLVTITAVEVSRDVGHAKIFITVIVGGPVILLGTTTAGSRIRRASGRRWRCGSSSSCW